MPRCGIISCGLKKDKNHPGLTLHSIPRNQSVRKKWLDVVGSENLNLKIKDIYICSMHFEESCFNRTLDVVRLQDNSIPSLNLPYVEPARSIPEMNNTYIQLVSNLKTEEVAPAIESKDVHVAAVTKRLLGTRPPPLHPSTSKCLSNQSKSIDINILVHRQSEKIKKLIKTCTNQRKTMKRLYTTIRRREQKIAALSDIIKKIGERKLINNEESLILKECAGPKDFVQRGVAKSKSLPVQRKCSDELRKKLHAWMGLGLLRQKRDMTDAMSDLQNDSLGE